MKKFAYKDFQANQLTAGFGLKSAALLFDKIFMNELFISGLIKGPLIPRSEEPKANYEITQRNIKEIEWLIDQHIVELVELTPTDKEFYSELTSDELDFLGTTRLAGSDSYRPLARLATLVLRKKGYEDVYPLLESEVSFLQSGKRHQVTSFILHQLPFPDDSCSWEQIIDFRVDEDAKSKYYALIKWINDVAVSNKSLEDIEEEYLHFYRLYMKQFKLHRMKATLAPLTIIVSGGMEIFTKSYGLGIAAGLLTLKMMNVSLTLEELKFPGREIAYIHHANQKFT